MLYDWLKHIEFKNQWVLPFLLALPLIAWYYYRTASWRKSSFKVTSTNAFTVRTIRNSFIHLPFWFRLLATGCVILALARPQVRNVSSKTKGQGIDIVLCMDISGSMNDNDFAPTRLEAAKQMAIEFVRRRDGDRIGLVIFGGESYTQYPLSTDYEGLIEQISSLRTDMLAPGTVIGEGLATSVQRLANSKSKTKIIVLLTDGNEQPPPTRVIDPLTALEIAKAKGVKVYTIGLGALGTKTVENPGSENATFLDESLLKKIALQTGGSYFRAVNTETLRLVYNQINSLEKSDVEIVTKTKFEEEYGWFILAALFFVLLDIILRYTSLRTFP
jgi:Ca-activated chloride channel family protein